MCVKAAAWVQLKWSCCQGYNPVPVCFLSFTTGHVHRGGCEVLPSRAGSGTRPFAQPGNHIQGSQTGKVRVAQLSQGSEFSPEPAVRTQPCSTQPELTNAPRPTRWEAAEQISKALAPRISSYGQEHCGGSMCAPHV